MAEMDPVTDVVELCAILQCLGYTVKSLDTSDVNISQDTGGGARTIVINCQTSGLHVVLESASVPCSCPVAEQQNSGFWQVSGITGGKQHDKESGSALLGSLPRLYRDRLTKELRAMVLSIRALSEDQPKVNKSASMLELGNKSASLLELKVNKSASLVELNKGNKSASMIELSTPEKRHMLLKVDTPTRCRSLDALTSAKDDVDPPIRTLQHQYTVPGGEDVDKKENFPSLSRRQSTYTICSTPGSIKRRNKTSSPIQAHPNNLLDSLMDAEKAAESLRMKLSMVIKEFLDDAKNDSSMSSMLDVSKISVLKGIDTSKAQFASSPNLSGLGNIREEFPKSRLMKRFESSSTSNLAPKPILDKDVRSKFRRLSPSIFKLKKDPSKADKVSDGKSKLPSLLRPKIVTPVRKTNPDLSSNLSSASKKKFSHVKSTIPRPTPKKD